MKYVRTEYKITTSDKVTHELIEDICDKGYLKHLRKGSLVRISEEWVNYYGRWVDIINEKEMHYSIRPAEVESVVKPLRQSDNIEELLDELVLVYDGVHLLKKEGNVYKCKDGYEPPITMSIRALIAGGYGEIYGAIWTKKGLVFAAKMNEKEDFKLL